MVSMKAIFMSVTDAIQGLTVGNMRCYYCLEPLDASLTNVQYKIDYCPAAYLCQYRKLLPEPGWDWRVGNWTLWPDEDVDSCGSASGRWYYGPPLR